MEIYENQGGNWNLTHTLSEHTQTVTGISWAAGRNTLVTCGHDRNAYVWEFVRGKWEPTLVILRVNRGATQVKWCAAENKFAVSSGSKCVAVCYFDPENNWWVSKHIKKEIKSTVTCLAWHPNSYLIAAGATDFKARIYSAAIKGVDKKPTPTPWGSNFAYGEMLAEFDHGTSWVHSISFSPSGSKLGYVTHDSSLVVVEEGGFASVTRTQMLPFTSMVFVSENTILAGGHDSNIAVLTGRNGAGWAFQCLLDQKDASKKKAGAGDTSAAAAARNKFAAADSKGAAADGEEIEVTLPTLHQNAIRELAPMAVAGNGMVSTVSSAGSDGLIHSWSLPELEGKVQGLNVV